MNEFLHSINAEFALPLSFICIVLVLIHIKLGEIKTELRKGR